MLKAKSKPAPRANAHCRKCSAWRTANTICVSGRGSSTIQRAWPQKIDILFVGEGPGKDEDKVGASFSGAAGGVLQSFLESYLKSKYGKWKYDWWLTNSVRCFHGRKPNGELAKPTKESMSACRTYLEDEIRWFQPRVIVPLGKIALGQVLDVWHTKLSMKPYLGKPTNTEWNIPAFALYHPSWVQRGGIDSMGQGANVDLWERQWDRFMDYLEGRDHILPGDWTWLDNDGEIESFYRDELIPMCSKSAGRVVFDYETTGLDPYSDSLRMVGYARSGQRAVVHPLVTDSQKELHRGFLLKAVHLTAHQSLFDLSWARVHFHLPEVRAFIHDTKFLSFLIDENQSHKLGDLIDRYLPEFSGFKDPTDALEGGVANAPTHLVAERCAYDCMATFRLREVLMERLTEKQKVLYVQVLQPMIHALVDCRINGWKTDTKVLVEQRERLTLKAIEIYQKILAYPEAQIINSREKNGLNLNSSTHQVPELLKAVGVDDENHRQPASPNKMSTAESVLALHKDDHPVVQLVIDWRGVKKTLNTFVKPFLEEAEKYGGYIRPVYNWGGRASEADAAGGTVTGRLSASRVMNFDPSLSPAFVSRFEDGWICRADYDQGEYRLMGVLSGEPKIFDPYKSDPEADFHQLIADMHTDGDRDKGKTINFGLGYGMEYRKLARELGVSENVAKAILEDYWDGFPILKKFFSRVRMLAVGQGFYEGVFGQILHCPDAQSSSWGEKSHAMRRVGNFPLQNALALLCLRAMGRIRTELRRLKMKSLLIAQDHDAVKLDVYPTERKAVEEILHRVMTEEPLKLYDWLTLPMTVDVEFERSM